MVALIHDLNPSFLISINSGTKTMEGTTSSVIQDPPPKRNREDLDSVHAIDRISKLPDLVLHHILSFLPTKDVVRTSLLSKTHHRASTSFPISEFYESWVCPDLLKDAPEELLFYYGIWRKIEDFISFVLNSLQRQSQCYQTIPRFALSMHHYFNHTYCIDDCVELASRYNVKELELSFTGSHPDLIGSHYYNLPQILLSTKDLVILRLYGCQLTLPPTHAGINWPSLSHLCLEHCHVDERTVQNLIFGCPFIEKLLLSFCSGNKGIRISGLTKLTEFSFTNTFTLEQRYKLWIDVPCLKTFCLFAQGHCNIDVITCKSLVKLEIKYYPRNLTGQDLTDLISRLPDLKSLVLYWRLERINFLSQKLEELELRSGRLVGTDLTDLISGLPALKFLNLACHAERIILSSQRLEKLDLQCLDELFFDSVEYVSIDVPSLKSFKCDSGILCSEISVGRSSPQEVTICCYCSYYLYNNHLLKLRKLLESFNQIELLNLHFIPGGVLFVPAELRDILLPGLPDVKRLELCITSDSLLCEDEGLTETDYKALMNGLLWMCRPECISLYPHSCSNDGMIKVLCEELMESILLYSQKSCAIFYGESVVFGKNLNCCSTEHIKCWRHYLKSFQIKQVGDNGEMKAFTSLTLLESLPTLPPGQVSFMLEW